MTSTDDVILTRENALDQWRNSKLLAEALAAEDVLNPVWTKDQHKALFFFYAALKRALVPCAEGTLEERQEKAKVLGESLGLELTTTDGQRFHCKDFKYPLAFIIKFEWDEPLFNKDPVKE